IWGRSSIVKCLASYDADIKLKSNEGRQSIHYAAKNGHNSTLQTLIQLGADVNCKTDQMNCTPLWFASSKGHDKVIKILLKNKAQIDLDNIQGATPLFAASRNGHVVAVHMLLTNGASVNSADSKGATPLIYASLHGMDEVVSLLILYGANIEAVTNDGGSSLLLACKEGNLSTVKLLIQEGANPHVCDKNGKTPIQLATEKGHNELAVFLRNLPIERIQSKIQDQEASYSQNRIHSGQSIPSLSAGTTNFECVVCMDDPRT
ncbi:unnamed protein product, partial [Meganyctiphanes norvegica]